MVTGVHHDVDVPVEVSLFRLAVALLPHAEFFFINMLHYVMIAVFVGIICGAVAAVYVTVISKLFTLPSSKDIQSLLKRQTLKAPIIAQALETFESHALDVVAKAEAIAVKVKQEPKIEETKDQPVPDFLENAPIIKREPIAPVRFAPVATGEDGYEDDDGYTYMTYGSDSQVEEFLELSRRASMAPIEEEIEETPRPSIAKEEEAEYHEDENTGDKEDKEGEDGAEKVLEEGDEDGEGEEELEEQNELEEESDEDNKEVESIEGVKDEDAPKNDLTSGGIEKLENVLTEPPEVIVTQAKKDQHVEEEEDEGEEAESHEYESASTHLDPYDALLEAQLESKLKTKLDRKLQLSNQTLQSPDLTSEASEISEQSEEVSEANSLMDEFSDSHGSPHLLDDGHNLRTLDSIYSVTNTLFSRADAATLHSEYISDDDK